MASASPAKSLTVSVEQRDAEAARRRRVASIVVICGETTRGSWLKGGEILKLLIT